MRKRILPALLALTLYVSALAGCKKAPEPIEATTFAMDTIMQITLYAGDVSGTRAILDELTAELARLDEELSATREDSDISRLNRAEGQSVEVETDTVLLLDKALKLCAITDGALDITAYPAIRAWGFTTGEYRVPSDNELVELAAKIDYRKMPAMGVFQAEEDIELCLDSQSEPVHIEEGSAIVDGTVTLPAGMEIDLGAVAKGWAGDRLASKVERVGITSGLLSLGQSTIVAIGTKPDGSPWRIGVQDPEGEGYFAVVELVDCAMGTSGGYQRFFEEDGVTYWHILDPETAAPARSGLASVTVVSPSGLVCDGLSTALFVMGLEEGAQFWRAHPELEFEAIFVTEDGAVSYTAGLKDCFTLTDKGREVTVLE